MQHIEKTYITEEGEIVREIIEDESGGFYVSEKHTIADIFRWCVAQGYWPEMVTLHELETETANANTQG